MLLFVPFQIFSMEEIRYKNKFILSMDKNYFIYQDSFFREKIKVKKCNRKEQSIRSF